MTDALRGGLGKGSTSKEPLVYCKTFAECQQALDALRTTSDNFSIIYVEIHGFDEAIESMDEKTVQQVMAVLSARLTRCVRDGDIAYRVGNATFVIVIHGAYAAGAFQSLQDRIRNTVEAEIVIEGKQLRVAVDFGYANYPTDSETAAGLIEHAHLAMERSMRSAERANNLEQQIAQDQGAGQVAVPYTNGNGNGNGSARAYIDELTGLPDAQLFRMRAGEMLSNDAKRAEGLSVVFCDIEEFKTYNLKYGYVAGDDLLKFLADTLLEAFPGCPIARLNSDRFCILAPTDQLFEKLELVHDAVRGFRSNSNAELKAGIYDIVDDAVSISQAQDYARLACDSIKGRYDITWRRFDDELNQEVSRRQYIVDNLSTAINSGWIEAYFQPIVRATSGKVCGMEALVRWNDPELGMLPPNEFIDVLEEARLIHKLDIQMVKQVCELVSQRLTEHKECPDVSLNLSRLDYQLCDIFSIIDEIVERSGVPRNLLHIEFTESAFTEDAEFFTQVIGQFRDAGYQVWMDDFGSGYSSLNLLKDYEFDVLKIDMEFLRGLEKSVRTRDIVLSVVDMAKKLGIQTLAEGVETEEQFKFLQSIGCEMLQGYYFSKPRPVDEIAHVLEDELPLEEANEHSYYNAIGKVNLLSPSPFHHSEASLETLEADLVLPLAIMEREGNNIKTIASTSTFDDIVHETGLVEDNDAVSDKGARVVAEIMHLGDMSDEADSVKVISFYDFKDLYTVRMQHLASTGTRHAYLIALDKRDTTKNNMAALTGGNATVDVAAAQGRMVYLPQAQTTPWQQSDEIDLSRTALVVVDVLGGSEGATPGLEDTAANCVTLAKAARAANIPVVFSIDNHIAGLDRELDLWGNHGVQGTEGGVPLDDFDVCESDFIIPKRRYNGFFQTDLELTLQELEVDTLIMVGYDTNITVLQTLAGAYFLGYKTIVPADATATFLVGNQEYALDYFTHCYDTRVVDTATVLKYFQRAQ